ncbi:MAG: Gfo/Idh/MocA family protein, partial [Desulfobulbia bacterium]
PGASGIVVDKIYLPGLRKLKGVVDSGFLDRILSVKVDFGYWIFDGEEDVCQRPSWNYKSEEGGGLVLDMFPHWSYILHHLFGRVTGIFCRTCTQIPKRWDENHVAYDVDVEDSAFALMTLGDNISVQLSTSWATRVHRSDLLTIQVDGTGGSAVATLHDCFCQSSEDTPKPYFDPVNRQSMDFFSQWTTYEDEAPFKHSFRYGWEGFLRHIVDGEPFPFGLQTGLEALQLIEAAYKSTIENQWMIIDRSTQAD